MTDMPVSINPSVFMPKDDHGKLFVVVHQLYHRLGYIEARIECVEYNESLTQLEAERDFLRNLLDCFERS